MASSNKFVQQVFKKFTHAEHIINRGSTYIGDTNMQVSKEWIIGKNGIMVKENCTYSPGLIKIIDEILTNAMDHYQRNAGVTFIEVSINSSTNTIIISNDGKCIPIEKREDTDNLYVPSFIFGVLLTSSNYDDNDSRTWNGTNGYGAKLTNLYSKKFTVETYDAKRKLLFTQTWENNMSIVYDPVIEEVEFEDEEDNHDYTTITFTPDLTKFDNIETISLDHQKIICKRLLECSVFNSNLKVSFNDSQISCDNFIDYARMYLNNKNEKLFYDRFENVLEYIVLVKQNSNKAFSFVNSAATPDNGTHVSFVLEKIIKKIKTHFKKVELSDSQIKKHLMLFCSCKIINPSYHTQMKTKIVNKIKDQELGMFEPSDYIINDIITNSSLISIIENELSNNIYKETVKNSGKKEIHITNIPKLNDANDAGTKRSDQCILILTEGDSAKSTVISGFSVTGRDSYGVFPLKGKLLNVKDKPIEKIMKDPEISNLVKILGLSYTKKYETKEELNSLRYGKVRLLTDQDHDGSHIKGLVLNMFSYLWPNLLKLNFVEQMITPIVKAKLKKDVISFYNLKEFEEWKNKTPNYMKYNVKYYKGLGSSTKDDAREYFSNEKDLVFTFIEEDDSLDMAFSEDRIEDRKDWLRTHVANIGNLDNVLYNKETLANKKNITTNEFVHKELVHFSLADVIRSIPNVIDGLKPSQRKIMHTCFTNPAVKGEEGIKVERLSGFVSTDTAYHHGEASLHQTVIGLAQKFVGSNNLNLLLNESQFGTRIMGGKDAAQPRYLLTKINPLTSFIFRNEDRYILTYKTEETMVIEPEFYVPIIPMILINGAKGIGTGWSTNIPSFSIIEIIKELRMMLANGRPSTRKFIPYYNNLKTKILEDGASSFLSVGLVHQNPKDFSVLITELPLLYWTNEFEKCLDKLLDAKTIKSYKQYSDEDHVCFLVYFSEEQFKHYSNLQNGFHKLFKLQTDIKTSNLVAFNKDCMVTKYNNVNEIINEFYHVRLHYYQLRKRYLINVYKQESLIFSNKARFIAERCEKRLHLENMSENDIIKTLIEHKYDSDPRNDNSDEDFDYLLDMKIHSFSAERINLFLQKKREKEKQLETLCKTSLSELWIHELDELEKAFRASWKPADDFKLPKNIQIENFTEVPYYYIPKAVKGKTIANNAAANTQ